MDVVDSNKIQRTTWRESPQGSALSPLVYNIYTADLETALGSTVKVLQDVDDMLIYSTSTAAKVAASHLNMALESFKIWLDKNGFEISIPKISVVLFPHANSS